MRVRPRSLNYWEAGRTPVPVYVAETIEKIDRRFDEVAAFALEKALAEGADLVILRRFRDVAELHEAHPDMCFAGISHHAALLERSRRRLIQAGFSVEIVYA